MKKLRVSVKVTAQVNIKVQIYIFPIWFKSEQSNSCKSMMVGKNCKKM